MKKKIKKLAAVLAAVFKQTDAESQVESSTDAVKILAYCGALGARSVLECPDYLAKYHRKFRLRKTSYSSLQLTINNTSIEDARRDSYKVAGYLHKNKKIGLILENGQHAIVLHCDGSRILTHYGVSATYAGPINHAVDLVPSVRGGQECDASVEILRRSNENGIHVDIITNDGIAYNRNYFKEVRESGSHYFVRIRGDDERNLQVIEEFEHALKIRETVGMETKQLVHVYDDVKFTVSVIVEDDPVLKQPQLVAKIESEPVGAKLQRVQEKDKKKAQPKDFHYKWEEEDVWEEMRERKMSHYVVTSAAFLTPLDVLEISISHWTIETHWRKMKRAYWSRNSYKRDPQAAIVLFIGISAGMATTEYVKQSVLLEDIQAMEFFVEVFTVLRIRSNREKVLTLKRVRDYINDAARSRYFEL